MRSSSLAILFILAAFFSAPFLASAATQSGGTGVFGGTQSGGTGSIAPPTADSGQGVTLSNPLSAGTSLSSFLSSILQFVIRIGTIVVVLMVVFVGYKFVVAQGSDTKLTEAKTMLLWTIIGALILLGAQAIATGIQATVNALGG